MTDWTPAEMFEGIYEAVGSHVTTAMTGRGVVTGTCGLDGCSWRSNPRGSAEDVAHDVIKHAVEDHAAAVRKAIRAIQRRTLLASDGGGS